MSCFLNPESKKIKRNLRKLHYKKNRFRAVKYQGFVCTTYSRAVQNNVTVSESSAIAKEKEE